MKLEKSLLILAILISAFVFSVSFGTLYAQTNILEGKACYCTLPIPLLIPTFASFGLFIGLLTFYLLSPWFGKKESKTVDLILDLLDPEEKEVIQTLIKNDGKVLQARLSRKIGKVRCFRVLERLKRRGIIEKEKRKKTNIVKLTERFIRLIELH